MAQEVFRKFVIFIIVFNIFFSLGEFGFWIAASALRTHGYDYQTYNVLIGTGFAWQGLLSFIYGVMILATGRHFVVLLSENKLADDTVQIIIIKVKWFTIFVAFLAINVAFG